ncbi:hypothetical protein F0562_033841 [Nyssa sinensis]|uniref:Uncharacterized protein n=1 Tax=Nyssa sinensis TaxID=561372 RepID=A0A5J5AFI5_9ASTE|nr:hypothetical protein F0562_033841 [Nyssa sinensis]
MMMMRWEILLVVKGTILDESDTNSRHLESRRLSASLLLRLICSTRATTYHDDDRQRLEHNSADPCRQAVADFTENYSSATIVVAVSATIAVGQQRPTNLIELIAILPKLVLFLETQE